MAKSKNSFVQKGPLLYKRPFFEKILRLYDDLGGWGRPVPSAAPTPQNHHITLVCSQKTVVCIAKVPFGQKKLLAVFGFGHI